MLLEKSYSLTEILSIDSATLTRQRHNQATTVIRTTMDRLGVDILNLFPPTNRIFWSFGVFASQDQTAIAYSSRVQKDALEKIDAVQRRLGLSRRSVNAYEFLAPVTKGMGDKYYPYSDSNVPVPYWWFAQRHVYVACPSSEYTSYLDYFSSQLIEIGDDCFRTAPDEKVLVDLSQYKGHRDYEYLTAYVTRMPPATRSSALQALTDPRFLDSVDPDVIEIVGCRGGPEVALLEDLKNIDDSACVQEILCRRVELALQFATLLCLERMYIDLAKDDWFWNPEDRDRMLVELDQRISKFPVIGMKIE